KLYFFLCALRVSVVNLLRGDAFGRLQAKHFAGQVLIVRRAGTLGSVSQDRLAEARAFGQLDVPADTRLEDLGPRPGDGLPATLFEIRFQVADHFLSQPRRRLVEADNDAGHFQDGIDPLRNQS